MIIAIDIGGTKTLVAICSMDNKIIAQQRFDTPNDYYEFLQTIDKNLKLLKTKDAAITVVAVPGKLDRKNGIGLAMGNLLWQNVPIAQDIAKLTNTAVIIENDANLAGLSETHLLHPIPKKSLYITVSTGIGTGIITNGYINSTLADSEGGSLLMLHNGHLAKWESFASGHAIIATYGQRASELNDKNAWKVISKDLALGIVNLCAIIQPDVIIIGGGVGTHFDKYRDYLQADIAIIKPPLVYVPQLVKAQAPEEAVIYGCIQLAKQHDQHR
jgi:glucokinase